MRSGISLIYVFIVFLLSGFPVISVATNGNLTYSYGVRSYALEVATIALPQDALAAATKPAGIVFVNDSLDTEIELFSHPRQYTVSCPHSLEPEALPQNTGKVGSVSECFSVSTFVWNHKVVEEASTKTLMPMTR